MGDRRGRDAPARRIETDVVVQEVDRASHEAGQHEHPQQPVLDRDVEGKREEVEADVLFEQRIAAAVGRLVEEPEDEVPPAALAHGDEQPEDQRDDEDDEAPYERRGLKRVRTRPTQATPERSRRPDRTPPEALSEALTQTDTPGLRSPKEAGSRRQRRRRTERLSWRTRSRRRRHIRSTRTTPNRPQCC